MSFRYLINKLKIHKVLYKNNISIVLVASITLSRLVRLLLRVNLFLSSERRRSWRERGWEDTLTTSHTALVTFLLLPSLHHSHLQLPEDLVKPGLQRLLDIEQQTQELRGVGRSWLDFFLLEREIILRNCSW